jgi:hypothetical protein
MFYGLTSGGVGDSGDDGVRDIEKRNNFFIKMRYF